MYYLATLTLLCVLWVSSAWAVTDYMVLTCTQAFNQALQHRDVDTLHSQMTAVVYGYQSDRPHIDDTMMESISVDLHNNCTTYPQRPLYQHLVALVHYRVYGYIGKHCPAPSTLRRY